MSHFGEHLTLDGYGGSAELLNDQSLVKRLLNELPKALGMNALIEPIVVLAPENNFKDPGGWSGFVIIAESHISLHTFPKRGFISADVYTCQNGLDQEKIKQYFIDMFDLKELEINFIIRGTKYPEKNII
jgi:S-adenosylmethionine decarboxylase